VILFDLLSDGQRRISTSFTEEQSSLWCAFITFIDGYGDDRDVGGGFGIEWRSWISGISEVEASAMQFFFFRDRSTGIVRPTFRFQFFVMEIRVYLPWILIYDHTSLH